MIEIFEKALKEGEVEFTVASIPYIAKRKDDSTVEIYAKLTGSLVGLVHLDTMVADSEIPTLQERFTTLPWDTNSLAERSQRGERDST